MAVLDDLLRPLGDAPLGGDRRAGASRWALPLSATIHGLFLLAIVTLSSVKPVETPPLSSIDVQIISELPPPSAPQPQPAPPPEHKTPAPSILPAQPPALPVQKNTAAPNKDATADGMSHPSHLLAAGLLREAASREVRLTLPKLAPSERATQLCNIEATEQIQAAYPSTFPDTVRASALADTTITGYNVVAPGAAYRSKRQWYAVSFICLVAPDYQSVTDFRFKVGEKIPRSEWDSHNLNAEDANE